MNSKIRPLPTSDIAGPSMTASSYVTPEALRTGDPHECELSHLVSADGRFVVGIWSAEPYSEHVDSYGGYEYTRVIEGRVTLTDTDGVIRSFGPGDAFTIEPGWSGEYRVDERLMKQFVYYESDDA
ncbi:cupin domain-containing protein [Agromyces endophyticus]|uniref:cupin domain-containing protein n=1 Tax=Agromyces sp. H17E-10 TaxID=2932244 RepID=UPI001FCFE9A6|nr:cupin domain-containing protein [Agromyces sp. H17E-10]UOQ89152.1 cupin domain-containing protein [Agromyces sp. H17E-10]